MAKTLTAMMWTSCQGGVARWNLSERQGIPSAVVSELGIRNLRLIRRRRIHIGLFFWRVVLIRLLLCGPTKLSTKKEKKN